ncbi:MAG: hypothetical protein ACKO37_07020 [Vampirovibrionales bacterium]
MARRTKVLHPQLLKRYLHSKAQHHTQAFLTQLIQTPKAVMAHLLQDPLWDAKPIPAWKAMQQTAVQRLLQQVQVGDMLAFGGVAPFSRVIQWVTRSEVSHVALVARREEDGTVVLIEANQGNGFDGVQTIDLQEKCLTYVGNIWWLPLNTLTVRPQFSSLIPAFQGYLEAQLGKPYDMFQAAMSAIDPLGSKRENKNREHTYTSEDATRFFCSELVAATYQAIGLIDPAYDPTELTPIDCVRLPLFDHPAYQVQS